MKKLIMSLITIVAVLGIVGCGEAKTTGEVSSKGKSPYTMRSDGYKLYTLGEMSVEEFPDLIEKDSEGKNDLSSLVHNKVKVEPNRFIANGSTIEMSELHNVENYAKILEEINKHTPIEKYAINYLDKAYYEKATEEDKGKTGLSEEHFKERILNHGRGRLIVCFSNDKIEVSVTFRTEDNIKLDKVFVHCKRVEEEVPDDLFTAEFDGLKTAIKLIIMGEPYGGDVYDSMWYIFGKRGE